MLGKLVVSTILIGAVLFTAVLIYTDKAPRELIRSITASYTEAPAPAASSNTLTYRYHVEADGLQPLDYRVAVRKVSHSKDTVCFTYRIIRVTSGTMKDVHDFMYGFMGYKDEGEKICTSLNPSDFVAKYFFTSSSVSGEASIVYGANGGLKGKAIVSNGVLQSMSIAGQLGDGRHASITITLEQ